MIDQLPPPTTDRAVPSVVTTDRAVPGPDQPDKTSVGNSPQQLPGPPPEPLNRRGRRQLAAKICDR